LFGLAFGVGFFAMGSEKIQASIIEFKLDPRDLVSHQVTVGSIRAARRAWWNKKRLRIAAHTIRIQRVLAQARRKPSRGRRVEVWCVQLRQKFRSFSSAGRFAKCRPHCVLRAIIRGGRCGGFYWELFDAARHKRKSESQN